MRCCRGICPIDESFDSKLKLRPVICRCGHRRCFFVVLCCFGRCWLLSFLDAVVDGLCVKDMWDAVVADAVTKTNLWCRSMFELREFLSCAGVLVDVDSAQ